MDITATVTYGLLFISLYFEIFMLVSFLERRFTAHASGNTQTLGSLPSVAIAVPCFNEEHSIRSTLSSLVALEYPAELLEILVVDDGSTDRTYDVAEAFVNERRISAPSIRLFSKKNGGKHTAMNFALWHTKAELIGCLDADSDVMPGALKAASTVFGDPKVAAVTPGIHTKEPRNMLQHMQKVEYRLSIFNRFVQAALGSTFITPGPFSIFRSSVVRELGGWRFGHSCEDMEMALRMQRAGYLIGNAPRAIVFTATPATLRGLFRQRVRWTYGFLRNAVDYRSMLGNKQFGDLGLMLLPCAIISIGAALYFFYRILYDFLLLFLQEYQRYAVTGTLPHLGFDLFYFNTSMMWFLVWMAVALILVLIAAGSFIGTGKRSLPAGTPLFVLFYSFLVPLWLGTALVRAVFKTGVRWR